MGTRKKSKKQRKSAPKGPSVPARFHSSVLQCIRQHARSQPRVEICGVLIGRQTDAGTLVIGAVAGEGATQGGSHVTFTQETWVRIHEEREKRFPDQAIVGWYHSHPGFGVFLSDHDLFIHRNFFSDQNQLAWVYDPHSDEEGCFGWIRGEVQRLTRFEVITEAEKKSAPRSEPSPHMGRRESKALPSFFSCPRVFPRILLLLGVSVLLGVLIVLGWLLLRETTVPDRLGRLLGLTEYDGVKSDSVAEKHGEKSRKSEDPVIEDGGTSGDADPINSGENLQPKGGRHGQ